MYAPGPAYGYGPGNTPVSAPFNPNGLPPQPHGNPHQQQQQQQQQQPGLQHQLQQPQQMMYNPQQQQQQYGPLVSHPTPYGTPSPGMGGPSAAMGMVQNNGMAHMAGGHGGPSYQTPYSSSPYGGGMPSSTASTLPPNFMPTSSAQAFNMNTANMNMQQQAHRMQPPPASSTPTQSGHRGSPFAGAGQHNTPPNASTAQSQFSPPPVPNHSSIQTSNLGSHPQGQSASTLTPQTPTFPTGSNTVSTPMSPTSESREKERVTLLLEINRELLMEVMRLQNAHGDVKKDDAAAGATSSPDGSEKDKAEKAKQPTSREYFECMRRLQSNLAYLAAIADRSHKPSSQIPAHPAIMVAPAFPNASASPTSEGKKAESGERLTGDSASDEDRSEILREQYKKLQTLFPGVDPKKEPAARAAAMQAQRQAGALPGAVIGPGGGMDMAQQQKMQNDLMRQKMMQAQAQQQMAQQQMQQMQQSR